MDQDLKFRKKCSNENNEHLTDQNQSLQLQRGRGNNFRCSGGGELDVSLQVFPFYLTPSPLKYEKHMYVHIPQNLEKKYFINEGKG